MRFFGHRWKLRSIATACVVASLLEAGSALGAVGMMHRAALEQVLLSCGEARVISEVMTSQVDKAVRAGYAHLEAAPQIKRRMTTEASARRFAPLYAYISESEAVRLDAWCKTVGGGVIVREHVDDTIRSINGHSPLRRMSTESEGRAAAVALQNKTAVAALRRLYTTPDAARGEVQEWLREVLVGQTHSLGKLADAMQAQMDHPEHELPLINGDGSIADKLVRAVLDELKLLLSVRRKYDEAADALVRSAPMAGTTLVSPMAVAASRECLDQARVALNATLSAAEAYPERLRSLIAQQKLPPALAEETQQGVNRGAARLYDWSLRMGENQRAIFRVYETVLALADAEAGHLRHEDGILLFDHEDALVTYRALVAEVADLAVAEEKLLAEQRALTQSGIDKLRSAGQ